MLLPLLQIQTILPLHTWWKEQMLTLNILFLIHLYCVLFSSLIAVVFWIWDPHTCSTGMVSNLKAWHILKLWHFGYGIIIFDLHTVAMDHTTLFITTDGILCRIMILFLWCHICCLPKLQFKVAHTANNLDLWRLYLEMITTCVHRLCIVRELHFVKEINDRLIS